MDYSRSILTDMFKKYLIIVVALGALIAGILVFFFPSLRIHLQNVYREIQAPNSVPLKDIAKSTQPTKSTITPSTTPSVIPEKVATPEPVVKITSEFNIAVPFMTQSPLVIWDEVHNETCEEAAALMVYFAVNEIPLPSKEEQEEYLQQLIVWQNEKFGDYKDTTAAQTALMMREKLNMDNVSIVENPTFKDIARILQSGALIIAPTSGKELFNPNFKNGGPKYHMVVVRGYDEKYIFTNDPGTRNGKNYAYTHDVFFNALHDWNDGDVKNGAKRILVITK